MASSSGGLTGSSGSGSWLGIDVAMGDDISNLASYTVRNNYPIGHPAMLREIQIYAERKERKSVMRVDQAGYNYNIQFYDGSCAFIDARDPSMRLNFTSRPFDHQLGIISSGTTTVRVVDNGYGLAYRSYGDTEATISKCPSCGEHKLHVLDKNKRCEITNKKFMERVRKLSQYRKANPKT